MVSEPTSTETTTESQPEGDAPSVIDETSPEVLAQEAAFFAGEGASVPESPEPEAGAQEVEDVGAGVESTATPEPQVATEQPAEKPEATEKSAEEDLTVPKHSEESMRRAQRSWDTQQAERDRLHAVELETVQKRLTDFDISAKVEAYLQAEIQQASTTMGAEDAERFVRQPTRISTIREGFEARAETERLQQNAVAQQAQLEQGYKSQVVEKLMTTHRLSTEDGQRLMGYNDPFEMQNMAIRLGDLSKQAAVVNSVPAETPATTVGTGTSTTNTQPSAETQAASLRQKTVLQMTDDEYEAARRLAYGG